MQTSLDRDLSAWLARYLAREVTLRQFQEWFVPATWNLDRALDARAADLAGEIELRLDEYSSGHLDEPQLRRELAGLVGSHAAATSSSGSR